jgi:Holliday junction resolvase RusA-like endonuclease
MTKLKNNTGKKRLQMLLPIPPSVNACYATDFKTKRRFKTKKYKTWSNEDAYEAWLKSNRGSTKGKVIIRYDFGRFPDKRKRDVLNFEKPLSDFLTSMGAFEDDCKIERADIGWDDKVETKMVLVTIEEII